MFWIKLKNNQQTIIYPFSFNVLMKQFTLIICCILCFCTASFAQDEVLNDSLTSDSVFAENYSNPNDSSIVANAEPKKVKKGGPVRNFFKKDYPNPTKAMILSFVIPGGGQLYNKKYWKAPIVWGTYGLMIYFIDFSSSQYKYLKQEYIYCVDGDEDTISELKLYKGWGEDDIKQNRDLFRKRMELSYIGLAAAILLSGIDAYVDAHLKGFDVSEDLTMRIGPKVDFMPYAGSSMGVGMSFHLNNKNKNQPKILFCAE